MNKESRVPSDDLALSDASARIVYATETVTRLIPYVDPGMGLPVFVQNACLEAWFTNLRLLAEFLIGSRRNNVMHAGHFLPNWEVADDTQRLAIRREYGLASEYVVHIGRRTKLGDRVDVSAAALRRRARLMVVALRDFTIDLEAIDPVHASAFRMAVEFGTLNLDRLEAEPGSQGASQLAPEEPTARL